MALRLSALGAGRALLPRKMSGTHFCQRLSRTQGPLRLEGLGSLKKKIHWPHRQSKLRPSGIFTEIRSGCWESWPQGNSLEYQAGIRVAEQLSNWTTIKLNYPINVGVVTFVKTVQIFW
jgi:hypothetical protein